MDRSQQPRLLGAIALAAVLACGAAAVWGYVAFWAQHTLDDSFFHSMSESLEITRDGRALVRHMTRVGGAWVSTYRTPDGQDVTEPLTLSATLVQLSPPTVRTVMAWSFRVLGYSDTRTVAAEWYLIRDQNSPGRGYFEIYDCQTRERLGFFGPQGFRADRPPENEQFANIPFNGCDALPIGYDDYGWAHWQRVSSIFLIAEGKLWLIDLEKRSIQPIAVEGEPVSVALATEFSQVGGADGVKNQILVRTSDSIVFFSAAGAPDRTLAIPADMRSRSFNVCRTADDEVVLTSNWPQEDIDVYWLGGKDGATRHEFIHLQVRTHLENAGTTGWLLATIFPAPLLEALLYPFYAYVQSSADDPPDMSKALGRMLVRDWPAIVSLFVVSGALAVLCYRHHSRYADRGGAAWALFVLVMGVPGAIGYWLHRSWPARERCAHCGAVVPRDRDDCLACEKEFAAPAWLGIEVFA